MNIRIPVRADSSVPLVDLVAQQADVNAEVMEGLAEVFRKAAFVGGPAVAEFEAAYAEFLGARHCVGVANGTDALELALPASGVGPGDEGILPANTFIATGVREGSFPVTERAAGRVLSLSLNPHITEAQQVRVARALSTAMSQR